MSWSSLVAWAIGSLGVALVLGHGARQRRVRHVSSRLGAGVAPEHHRRARGWLARQVDDALDGVGAVAARGRALLGAGASGRPRAAATRPAGGAGPRRRAAVAVAVVIGVAVAVGGARAALVVTTVLVVAMVTVVGVARHRAREALDEALPVVVDRVAVALRAGLSVHDGLRDGLDAVDGPARDDLRLVVAAVETGQPLVEALHGWERRRPVRGVRLVVAALTMGLEVGTRTRPLDGVAATLRSELVAQHEIRAAAAQARAQAVVMIGAPLLFLVANATRDPAGFGASLARPLGLACLLGAVVLDGAGAWWMVRLMRSAR